jgi:hypothetical protein
MVQLIVAPNEERAKHKNKLFLAGGITNCPDWQNEVIKQLGNTPITVYNPRRPYFDVTKKDESVVQITWEYHKLQEATELLFWFPKETLCPIVLFELGAHLRTDRLLLIGMHPEYQRRQDVEIQSQLARPAREISYDLGHLVGRFEWHYHFTYGLT